MTPTFWKALADPSIRRVFLCGCGGGFDFVHGLLLYQGLHALGKRIVIGSYSFGDPSLLTGDAPVVFASDQVLVKRVSASTEHDPHYAPEVHICSYLDACHPGEDPHWAYAYYARDFAVPTLTAFYRQVIREHAIDAIVLVDGGSDSLVSGDEHGLGDPIEDAVSVQSVAHLTEVALRILLTVGLGVDRKNGVSDHAALRAVAEITKAGGFLGALSLEQGSEAYDFYRRGVEHVFARQSFRSIVSGSILGAADGRFGSAEVPDFLEGRVSPGSLFLWPLMAMLWAFDVDAVAERSLLCRWIRSAPTPAACYAAVRAGRKEIRRPDLSDERLPEPQPWPLASIFDVAPEAPRAE